MTTVYISRRAKDVGDAKFRRHLRDAIDRRPFDAEWLRTLYVQARERRDPKAMGMVADAQMLAAGLSRRSGSRSTTTRRVRL